MPVESIGPSLQEFARMAAQASENRTIRSGKSLSTTRLPTWASTNRKAMQDFLSAMRKEFGSTITDAAAAGLAEATESGRKPLKAKMVSDTIESAAKMMQHNLCVRDKFLSNVDEDHGFDQSFELMRNRVGLEAPDLIERVKEVVREELSAFVTDTTRLTPEDVERRMSGLSVWQDVTRIKQTIAGRTLPGRWDDKLDVLRAMKGHEEGAMYALHRLPQCRWLQPQGRLTPDTIWAGAFEEKLPEGVTRESFAEDFAERVAENLKMKGDHSVKSGTLLACLSNMNLASVKDIAVSGRPAGRADFIAGDLLLRDCLKNVRSGTVQEQAAMDLRSVSATDVKGHPVASGAVFHLDGRDERLPFGPAARETIAEAQEQRLFDEGKPSSFTRTLREWCSQACGGRNLMTESLMSLFSQTPLRILSGQGATGATGALLVPDLNEHMPRGYDVASQPDGSVRVSIQTLENEELGRGRLTVAVRTDGELSLEDVLIESPDTIRHQRFGERVAERLAQMNRIPEERRVFIAQIVKSMQSHDGGGVYRRPRQEWDRIIDDTAALVNANSYFQQIVGTMPQHISHEYAQRLKEGLQANLAYAFQKNAEHDGEDHIAKPFYKDYLRGMVASYNGSSLPEVPSSLEGCDLPVEQLGARVRTYAMKEMVLGTIEDPLARRLATFFASQAGVQGAQSLFTMSSPGAAEPGVISMWEGQPRGLVMMMSQTRLEAAYNFPACTYDIAVDPLVPGTDPGNPVNADRKIHIVCHSQDNFEFFTPYGKGKVPLMGYRIAVDVPMRQGEGKGAEPVFEVLEVAGDRLTGV